MALFPRSICLLSKGMMTKGAIYMRPGRTQTGMNLYRYEIFAVVYMKPGRNNIFCIINVSLTQRHTGCHRSEICCHLHETVTRASRLGPVIEAKSDHSEFIVRPVSCKRKRRNI